MIHHPHPLLDLLARSFSGGAAKRHTAAIARFHRIQASPGYRAAAQWVLETLQSAGVQATIETYPATRHDRTWAHASFQEWACRDATLDWLGQDGRVKERLCDYRASAVSIIQRSMPVHGDFQVVDVGDGSPEAYEQTDVRGKLVLSRAPVTQTYREAVLNRGAAGILFDHIDPTAPGRNRHDLPDARQYASFWWGLEDPQAWGFVLTPRQGDALRAALAAGETVTLRAHIDAHFTDGTFENVVARIPGQGQGAVLAMAHLCHPQDFANDNASGAATLLETAITLQRLIDTGQVAPPQRSLIFLWMPEMTGTIAWLAQHEAQIPNIIAGINLDMVGEDQAQTGAILLIDSPPQAAASFAPTLLARLRDDFIRDHASFQQITTPLPLVRTQTIPFSGGSDHMITSDPAVGIPTPMLIQWPDRTYHTTADTMAMVSERSLWLAGALTGTYLLWLSQAGRDEALWLGWEMIHRYQRDMAQYLGDALAAMSASTPQERARAWADLKAQVTFRQDRMSAALASLERLAPLENEIYQLLSELNQITEDMWERAQHQVRPRTLPPIPSNPDPWLEHAQHIIPQRHYRAPIMEMGLPNATLPLRGKQLDRWMRLYQEHPHWRIVKAIAEYWTDGHRTLAEIAQLVQLETGYFLGPAIETYFQLLADMGWMTLKPSLPSTEA